MSTTKKRRRVERAAERADTAVCPGCQETFVLAHHASCPRCGNVGWTRESCSRCKGGTITPHLLDDHGRCSKCGGPGWLWYRA